MSTSRPMSHTINSTKLGFRSPRIRPQSPFDKEKQGPTMNYLLSPKFDLLHEKNKNGLGFLKDKEDIRQAKRKEKNNFSNLIDNYFNSEIHSQSWKPNGGLIIKRRYKYTGIGLDHFYEKNNVEQLQTIDGNEQKEKKDSDYLKDFSEFEDLKINEYMITIEHCASCEEHKYITQHVTDDVFKKLALNDQKIIRERFPFIKVFLKPIDVEIVKNRTFQFPKVDKGEAKTMPKLNAKFKQVRIGAFEIQIATRDTNNQIIKRIIHSKLKTKKFPDINTVLKKIVTFMPRFRLKLVLFDKEDYEEIEKMDNIQVNLYLCNSKMIKEVRDSTQQQVLNFTSPSRRLIMLKEQRLKLQQQNFLKNKNLFKNKKNINLSPISNQRITSAMSPKIRGMNENKSTKLFRPISSANYNFNNKLFESSNFKKTGFWLNSAKTNQKDNSKLSFSSMDSFIKNGKNINNNEALKDQKGVLIKRKYSKVDEIYKLNQNQGLNDDNNDEDAETSESVTLYFDDIPYDSYIIETIENSNFQGSLTLLKFNEIRSYKNNLVTKYIGLWHQENAILNIHLYSEKENKTNGKNIPITKNNNILMPNSTLGKDKKIIRPPSSNQRRNNINNNDEIKFDQEPILTGNINISNAEDPNSRYKVPADGKGIYVYKTVPGDYKLEVTNDDYEKVVMKVSLKRGLNTINIKLKPEKCCDLKIQVFEYNEYNYNYGIYYNNNEKKESQEQNEKNENENENEENNNKNQEDNIVLEPVRNAEIQIFKEGNELLLEGNKNKKGIIKYLIDKNENNLLIKVSKNGFYRVERVFKRNNNMKENEKGNYECTMTFILVRIERLIELNKMLFISYSNTYKKIFEFDVQNIDKERNKYIEKDMQEVNGVFIVAFNYEDLPRENEENLMDENEDKNISSNNNNMNNENKLGEDTNDFNENINYEEIIRIGLRISLDVIKDEYNQTYEVIRQNDSDLIEYLRSVCSDGNIYTPNYDFHINLPKVLSRTKISPKYLGDNENFEDKTNLNEYSNNINSNENSQSMNKNMNDDLNDEFIGLYWDLGWIDLKNKLFYETSVYFRLEYKPVRNLFFEEFIDFLQIFIDQRICDSLFDFFNFENSILASSDRYLPKKIFESKLFYIMDEDNRNKKTENLKNNHSQSNINKVVQKQKHLKKFIQFVCNILCGYDEENNIKDDSISFYLLRKKISSNLQNFLLYSSDGKKETIKSEENKDIRDVEE